MKVIALPLCLGLALLAACADEPVPEPRRDTAQALPGHAGPVPSVEARAMLKELRGRSFEDGSGDHGGGTWVVGAFGVVPNPVSGKGPVIYIERPESRGTPIRYGEEEPGRWIPMVADADIARFHELVTGEPASARGPSAAPAGGGR
jgi:hypothetical protein